MVENLVPLSLLSTSRERILREKSFSFHRWRYFYHSRHSAHRDRLLRHRHQHGHQPQQVSQGTGTVPYLHSTYVQYGTYRTYVGTVPTIDGLTVVNAFNTFVHVLSF